MASDAVDRFQARAAAIGIDIEVVEFPSGTRTAADAAAAIGCDVAQIVKSLVFMAGEVPVLALTSGANRVDESKVARVLGVSKVTKADASQVRSATGYAIGGVAPIGHAQPAKLLLDQDLQRFNRLWAAAGTPFSVFPLTPAQLQALTGAAWGDIKQ